MASKMATVEKAEELLEKLRSASWNSAVQGIVKFLINKFWNLATKYLADSISMSASWNCCNLSLVKFHNP